MYILFGFSDRARGEYMPILRVRDRLEDMKKRVRKAGNIEYRHMLEKEITTLVDNIATGAISRPETSIIDVAVKQLDDRINVAIQRGVPTEYNLRTEVKVIIAPDLSVYYSIVAQNKNLRSAAFSDGLVACHVKSEQSPQLQLWNELMDFEKTVPSLNAALYPQDKAEVDLTKLIFQSPAERARVLARYRMQNVFLSAYSAEPQIPQARLMEYLDDALRAVSSERNSEDYLAYMSQLKEILPEITLELIQKYPDSPGLPEQKNASADVQVNPPLS